MKASHLKGALLEYIIRNLLKNCGFTNVNADDMYSFEFNNSLNYHLNLIINENLHKKVKPRDLFAELKMNQIGEAW